MTTTMTERDDMNDTRQKLIDKGELNEEAVVIWDKFVDIFDTHCPDVLDAPAAPGGPVHDALVHLVGAIAKTVSISSRRDEAILACNVLAATEETKH